jgi:hypothetical protein
MDAGWGVLNIHPHHELKKFGTERNMDICGNINNNN